MLNLLISIIGESYDVVNSNERYNFNFERASSLRDIELSMNTRQKLNLRNSKYLFVGICRKEEGLENDIEKTDILE
jgi:hypothetical protein